MPFGGFIVNRVHADALGDEVANEEWQRMRKDPIEILQALVVTGAASLAIRMAENFERFQALADRDAIEIERLEKACAGPHVWRTVPAFELDIHDLSGLARVNGTCSRNVLVNREAE